MQSDLDPFLFSSLNGMDSPPIVRTYIPVSRKEKRRRQFSATAGRRKGPLIRLLRGLRSLFPSDTSAFSLPGAVPPPQSLLRGR